MKRFKKIYIEITNVCNLACSFCPRTLRRPAFMGLGTFSKIIDEITPYTDYVYFHVKGEPMLHPEIGTFIRLCGEKGLKVNITTNGTLIEKVKDKLVNQVALRQINFSLHSLDKNELMGNIKDYLSSIFEFTNYMSDNTNTIIAFRLWNILKDGSKPNGNINNQPIIEEIEKEFCLPFKIQNRMMLDRGIKLKGRVYLNFDYEFQWPEVKSMDEDTRGFCYGLKNQVAILVDGTVVPCCLDGEGVIDLGNIHERSFSEILGSERASRIYEGFSRREVTEELCRRCDYRRRFGL